MQGKGNQGESVARSRILLLNSYTNVDPYFQSLILYFNIKEISLSTYSNSKHFIILITT
jgi:hypothetical protein